MTTPLGAVAVTERADRSVEIRRETRETSVTIRQRRSAHLPGLRTTTAI